MSFSKLLLYSMCLVYGCIDYKTCTVHLSWFFFLKKRQPYETCRNCEIKKKGSNRKCVGYSNVSGMYGLCKTYAWASEFPDLFLILVIEQKGVGRWKPACLAFVQILPFALISSSAKLAKVIA